MLKSYRTNPWVVCLLPFCIFMLVGSLEPTPQTSENRAVEAANADQPKTAEEIKPAEATKSWFAIEYRYYPLVYSIKIALTLAAVIFAWPGYRQYTGRVSWLGVAIGVLGAVAWIALATWQKQWMPLLTDKTGIEWFKSLGQRSAFNPREQMHGQFLLAHLFLLVRFIGLALIVPIIEEFFLRGFVMRFVVNERWWEVPFGTSTRNAILIGTALPMLMHPQELVAALVWFSAVTWLTMRTRSIWDCILAHGITNLLLGIYVVTTGEWWLM